MDWAPVVDPLIHEPQLRDFQYDQARATDTKVPTVLSYQHDVFKSTPLENDADWEKWFQDDIFNGVDVGVTPQRQDADLPGFQILVSPVVEPMTLGADPQPIPRRHYQLPFSEARWAKIARAFMLHRAVIQAMRNNKCQSTYLAYKDQGQDLRNNPGAESKIRSQDLEMHTAVSASFDRPNSISLSCTYFSKARLSLAVIFACNSKQLDRVSELLKASPEAASQPLLLVGVFAELQLDRMQELVNEVNLNCDENCESIDRETLERHANIWALKNQIRLGVLHAREIEEEIRTTSANLKEMATRVEGQKKLWASWDNGKSHVDAADRFATRFREIEIEIDGLMAQCRVAAEKQTSSGELFQSEISRKQAQEASHQAKLSRVLATMAGFYLPMTSLATIFAVPVFKWDNDWIDARFRPVSSPASSPDDNGGDSRPPVLSGYGVVFIVVSFVMTFFTIGIYQCYASWRRDVDGAVWATDDEEKQTGGSLASENGTDGSDSTIV